MKKITIVTLGIAALSAIPPVASAQTTAVGYAFGAPGFATCSCGESISTLHAGGGGEARIGDSFGVSAEVGYLGPRYTMAFRDGTANLWNVGGGVDYWVSKRVGARFDVRDHVRADVGTVHFWGPRIGIVVRGL